MQACAYRTYYICDYVEIIYQEVYIVSMNLKDRKMIDYKVKYLPMFIDNNINQYIDFIFYAQILFYFFGGKKLWVFLSISPVCFIFALFCTLHIWHSCFLKSLSQFKLWDF